MVVAAMGNLLTSALLNRIAWQESSLAAPAYESFPSDENRNCRAVFLSFIQWRGAPEIKNGERFASLI